MDDQMTPAEMRARAHSLRAATDEAGRRGIDTRDLELVVFIRNVRAGADALDRLADGPRVITTEPEANALPVGTIIRDNVGDARRKVSERGWEQAGEAGRWGSTWIAFPATVLYTPACDAIAAASGKGTR